MTDDILADFLNKLNDLASNYGLVVGGYVFKNHIQPAIRKMVKAESEN